jgi:hypothetical protein
MNSPAKVERLKIFELNGSKHSLFPNIYDVDAVGINAVTVEFLTPYYFIFSLKLSQS